MGKTQFKNIVRGIRHNFLSWLSISIVTMLGCGVFFGAYFYTQSILGNTEKFFADTNCEDFNVLPTGGLKEKEIDQLRNVSGVADVEGTYRLAGSRLCFREQSIDAEIIGLTERISKAELLEGTLPARDGECAICSEYMEQYGIQLGDTVELMPGEDSPDDLLRSSTFRVTASVRHPDALWTGSTRIMVFLPMEAFDGASVDDNYTYIRLDAEIPEKYGLFSSDYDEKLTSVKSVVRSSLQTLTASHDERVRGDAQKELDDTKAKVERKLSKAKQKIGDAEREITDAEGRIADAEEKIEDAETKLHDAKKKIRKSKKKIKKAEKKLKRAKKQLAAKKKSMNGSGMPAGGVSADQPADQAGGRPVVQYDGKTAPRAVGQANAQADPQYNAAISKLKSTEKKLKKSEKKIKKAKKKLKKAEHELRDKEKELEDKKQELSEKEQELQDARKNLEEEERKYQEKKAETDEEIADAQEKIDEIPDSAGLFVTRNELDSFTMFRDDINIMIQLPTVFVIIFTLIGLIVVFSTITIQIDNQKKLIGAMMSFGFRSREIVMDFLFFGVSASALGMLMAVGLSAVLQRVFYNRMGPMFSVKPDTFSLQIGIVLMLTLVELLLAAAVAVFVTVHHAARYSAVDLMQGNDAGVGKSKAAGSAAGTLYSRLIFRNIRSDFARVVVTTVIIAGCCLVMGMGFTMDDALENMMPRSAKEINQYQMELSVTAQGKAGDYQRLADYLRNQDVEYAETLHMNTLYNRGEEDGFVTVITAEDQVFGDYIHMLAPKGKKSFDITESGPLVANKLSEQTGIRSGTKLSVYDSDGDYTFCEVAVGDVCRNYFGRNLYISKEDYVATFGEQPEYNTLLVRVNKAKEGGFVSKLREKFPQVSVVYTDVMPQAYEDPASLFHIMVFVMTLLSIILSVFVLSNLVAIFVQRRNNELIVMGINGFSFSQQIGYLLKETLMTTCMGLLLGTVMGCVMTAFVVKMVEGADAMFVRTPDPKAWLFAVAMEALFALCINLVAFRRVKHLSLTDFTR